MNTSSSNSLRRFKLLLFYLTLVLSVHHADSSTPKPNRSEISLEYLSPSSSTSNGKTNGSNIENHLNEATNLEVQVDREEKGADTEGDLDGSAANQDINISRLSSGNSNGVEEQVAAPSITTVHQVWASSSSDSLDELSPEVISKLRNDVPFLAAYSIRPRLVGASSNLPGNQQQSGALQAPSMAASEIAASRIVQAGDGFSPQTVAASPPKTSLSKLGNFNEFKVETSSTSKSEHHHKRKTVLKRKEPNRQPAELQSRRRQVSNTAKRLMAERRRKGRKSSNEKIGKRLKSNQNYLRDLQRSGRLLKRARSAAQNNQAKTSRLRRKLNGKSMVHHMNIIKHGRYLQEADDKGEGSSKSVKGDSNDTGVKGGSADGGKRTPFYSRAKPSSKGYEANEESLSDNSLGNDKSAAGGDTSGEKSVSNGGEGAGEGREEEEERDADESDDDSAAAALPEPKRVGDDDVEEDGDTVTVMPKYDGVDDDPEPPVDEEAGSSSSEREESPGEDGSLEEKDDGSEPRTRRVNRERPNQVDNGSSTDQAGTALGGGLGATIGGGSGSGGGGGGSGSDYEGKQMRDDRTGGEPTDDDRELPSNNGRSGPAGRGDSDVDDDSNPDEREPASDIERIGGGKSVGGSRKNDPGSSDGSNKMGRGDEGDSQGKGGNTASEENEFPDVDYRDEMDVAAGRKKKPQQSEHPKEVTPSKRDKDCDDGHYNHHDDHHHGHHDHHDTIKWLQDAIPGEPGADYPILSRANSTNFNCRDQKYPGYYADVEARCQIFHICQADGRQDSFLCPNGTIFSQISSVCVWWNSFDCEDAPKYYKLNELLYKSRPRISSISDEEDVASGARSPDQTTELRPLGAGAPQADAPASRRRANGNRREDDDESSIDDLIRDMQQRKAIGRQEGDATGVTYAKSPSTRLDAAGGGKMDSGIGGAYDEASIQRKSTNPIDEDLSGLDEASAQLKRQGRPRRKRRASAKQSPRKLKPGRYVRRRPVGKTINKIRGPATKQKRRA